MSGQIPHSRRNEKGTKREEIITKPRAQKMEKGRGRLSVQQFAAQRIPTLLTDVEAKRQDKSVSFGIV